ncbi:tRNA modification GTPase gtpbp3, mitochondrial [Apophysomyces ossiformis]|uniref:tRNA modification GTPase gtpbp3, mitochondrial n=1 Tax=Apophysomyces ossiformis TaxID=679940 RepID=A0A8H7BRX4_9FUNG|nr:tRNA modification GTPase gtpbp3, mitochondrial [Apophysomyces ossiformis]
MSRPIHAIPYLPLWKKSPVAIGRPIWHALPQRSSHTPAQTIYALSTSPGKAGVAVIRISGDHAQEVVRRMTGLRTAEARKAYFRRIKHPITGEVLDRGLLLWFPGPHSFTGEHTVELHIHGGNAVVKSVLDALKCIDNFRMAEQGEFARRAFYNDKLDLTELEGLADLLNAETEVQRRLALRQAEGGLRVPYEKWREQIISCMAHTEAVIDFGEDEQIEDGVLEQVAKGILELRDSIRHHLDDSHVGEIIRSGIQVAIVGPPNAGKSTLLNRLAKREAAIVSDIPGTTRDVVEVTLNLGGYPIVVSDTAGLRESEDVIEMEGVKRAKSRLQTSDIKICLLSLGQLHFEPDGVRIGKIVRDVIDEDTFVILNKQDMIEGVDTSELVNTIQRLTSARKVWSMSCKTGQGVDSFLQEMVGILKARFDASIASPVLITQARHRQHLEDCVASLDAYLEMPMEDVVLSAEELRQAANALGRITGRVDVEDVLDVLFGQFCIGK